VVYGELGKDAINWVRGNGQYHLAALGKRREKETDKEFAKRAQEACRKLFDPWIRTILLPIETATRKKATEEPGQDSLPQRNQPAVLK
jgi:hypothetical protein